MDYVTILIILGILLSLFSFLPYRQYGKVLLTIAREHYGIFNKTGEDKWFKHCLRTSVAPFVIAIFVYLYRPIDEDTAAQILTIFSILAGMLFSVLVLIIDLKQKNQQRIKDEKETINYKIDMVQRLIKETFNTIMYEIILIILVLIVVFLVFFVNDAPESLNIIQRGLSFLSAFLIFSSIGNLFIVLKRIYAILKFDFDN